MSEVLYRRCPDCGGSGVILGEETGPPGHEYDNTPLEPCHCAGLGYPNIPGVVPFAAGALLIPDREAFVVALTRRVALSFGGSKGYWRERVEDALQETEDLLRVPVGEGDR